MQAQMQEMVSAAGLEPTTHSLGNCCSILMSYADTLILCIKPGKIFCKQNFSCQPCFPLGNPAYTPARQARRQQDAG